MVLIKISHSVIPVTSLVMHFVVHRRLPCFFLSSIWPLTFNKIVRSEMNGSGTDRLNKMRLFTVKIYNMDKWQPLKNFFIQFIKIISQLFTKNVIKKISSFIRLYGTGNKEKKMKDQLLVEKVIFTRSCYFWIPSTSKRMAGFEGFFFWRLAHNKSTSQIFWLGCRQITGLNVRFWPLHNTCTK